MYKYLLIALFFIGHVHAQDHPKTQKVSIESGLIGYYPATSTKSNPPVFNYGANAMLIDKIGRIGLGLGISSSTNNFTINDEVIINGISHEVTMNYTSGLNALNLLIIWGMLEGTKWNLNAICGLSLNMVRNAKYETRFASGDVYYDNQGLTVKDQFANVNGGINLSRQINSKWSLVMRPTIIFTNNYVEQDWRNTSHNYPIDQVRWSLLLNVSYLIFQKDLPQKPSTKVK